MIKIPTFLSYSDKDKTLAGKLSHYLKPYDFEIFLAHDNIGIGVEWADEIKNEIYNCELFLVLLSENFKASEYTDHEVGIATAHNKRIFSIMIDDTRPYGFMYGFQGKQIDPELDVNEVKNLANELKTFTHEGQKIINELIEKLITSKYFREANAVARNLDAYPSFTNDQINKIAKGYVDNFEISGSWDAGPYASDLLLKNWNRISTDLKEILRTVFKKVL